MKQRMFGSRTVPKVAKYAVVIYMYTDDSKFKYLSKTAEAKARRTTKKMIQKLIDRLKKQPKYDFDPGNTNMKESEHLEHLLKNSADMKYFSVWMLQANQYVHEIIHELAQDYDPADNDAKKPDFFKEIFAELTNEN